MINPNTTMGTEYIGNAVVYVKGKLLGSGVLVEQLPDGFLDDSMFEPLRGPWTNMVAASNTLELTNKFRHEGRSPTDPLEMIGMPPDMARGLIAMTQADRDANPEKSSIYPGVICRVDHIRLPDGKGERIYEKFEPAHLQPVFGSVNPDGKTNKHLLFTRVETSVLENLSEGWD